VLVGGRVLLQLAERARGGRRRAGGGAAQTTRVVDIDPGL
jgi:transposase-like protein